jgi:hypothetical protein
MVVDPALCDSEMLSSLSNKAMESVRKEHMTTFHKRFHVCDPSLGPKFLQQVHVHYNMNPYLEIMIEKLQLFVSSQVSNEKKVFLVQAVESIPSLEGSSKVPKGCYVECHL